MAYPYRPYKEVYTHAEIIESCKAANGKNTEDSDLISSFRPPFSEKLVGKEFHCRFQDGSTLELLFSDAHQVQCVRDGGEKTTEYYDALESTKAGVFLVHFFFHTILPFEGATIVIDTESELVTWVQLIIGDTVADVCVNRKYVFGYYGSPKQQLHHYTDEMAGVLLEWRYSETYPIYHDYVTPYCMLSPGYTEAHEEDWLWRKTLPTEYAKIRDGLFLVSFIEDGGSEAALLIDLDELRDVGAFYGVGGGKFFSFTIGARATRHPFGIHDAFCP